MVALTPPTGDERIRAAFERVADFVDGYRYPGRFASLRSSSDDVEQGVIVTGVRYNGTTAPLTVGDLEAMVDAYRAPVRLVTPAGPPPTADDLRRAMLDQPLMIVQPEGHRLTDDEAALASEALAELALAEQVAGRPAEARRASELAGRLAPER